MLQSLRGCLSKIDGPTYFTFWYHSVTELKNNSWGGLFAFNDWCGFFGESSTLSLPLHSCTAPSYFMTTEAKKIRFYTKWDL